MKRFTIVMIVLALSLGLVAAAKPANLFVHNRSSDVASFYFYEWADGVTGVNPVLFVTLEAKTNGAYELAPGEYVVESFACGVAMKYQAAIRGHFNITVPACPRWASAKQQVDGGFKSIPMQ
jgi:hypothetical protein